MAIRVILSATVKASKRFTVWLSLPTVLFMAAIGPFAAGLHMVYAPLPWIVLPGAALGLAFWQALPPRGRSG